MEVLISMFVLSVGLLGVAALIPLGRLALVETGKADAAGACGHAGLREIKVRRMLDYQRWRPGATAPTWFSAVQNAFDPPAGPIPPLESFAVDPLGVAAGFSGPLGGPTSLIQRITLRSDVLGNAMQKPEAESIFWWHDDLEFTMPENMKPPPVAESDRPRGAGPAGLPDYEGKYSWFFTVTPAATEATLAVAAKSLYEVSVVVCYRRYPLLPGSEHTAGVTFLGNGWGGGSVTLASPPAADPPLQLKADQWIMLCGQVSPPQQQARAICKWYRVVSAADTANTTTHVSLVGPDWDTAIPTTAVAIDHVIGVYTTTMELNRDPRWGY